MLEPTHTEQARNNLRIWQQNVNRSLVAQLDLINNADPQHYDIIAIQEPHIDFQNDMRASQKWRAVLPTPYSADKDMRMRSCTLINAELNSVEWEAVPVDSYD